MWDLIGRNHFMLSDFKKASEAFEKARGLEPSNSRYAHWLGKAYGRRAETANPLFAPSLATKTRKYFEQAVALDPKNVEAMSDLLEYYLEAPGFLGGGVDKGVRLAGKIAEADPAEGAYALAKVAEKRKEFGQAEVQLRRAVEQAPMQIGRVLDLARFLSKQGRIQESDQIFQQAARINPNHPRLLFARAETYVKSKRNLDEARNMLRRYLNSPLTPDDPPRNEAEKLLKEAGG